jgi:hypothetical protein
MVDGRIVREFVPHGTPSGLSGIAFNLRRPLFQDRRVRKALTLAFDFEWINRALLHGGYVRTASMFDGSRLKPEGAPSGGELALLEPWRGRVPEEVFGPTYEPPRTDGSGYDRNNLRRAAGLLETAGWRIRDGRRVNAAGEPLRFEILLRNTANERIALAWSRALRRLGIDVALRLVDSAQFQGRIDSYDFDTVFGYWGVARQRAAGLLERANGGSAGRPQLDGDRRSGDRCADRRVGRGANARPARRCGASARPRAHAQQYRRAPVARRRHPARLLEHDRAAAAGASLRTANRVVLGDTLSVSASASPQDPSG